MNAGIKKLRPLSFSMTCVATFDKFDMWELHDVLDNIFFFLL